MIKLFVFHLKVSECLCLIISFRDALFFLAKLYLTLFELVNSLKYLASFFEVFVYGQRTAVLVVNRIFYSKI